jgi:nucleotide-binding universal stress UspA family protein
MKILIPVDGSAHGEAALAFVAQRRWPPSERPQVDLLNVQLPLPPRAGRAVDPDLARSWHEAEARRVLKPAAAVLLAAHLEPAWFHRVGMPGVVIGQWADEHEADLIVMGSHGRTALSNLVFGSVTQTVLATCRRPLLVLRSPRVPTRRSLRVGIAVDGSAYSTAAMCFVIEHAAFFGPRARFTLLHVIEPGEHAPDAPPPGLDDDAEGGLGAPAALGEPAVTTGRRLFAAAGLPVEIECVSGRAGVEIARFAASTGLDLLVMGSHGHGALTSAVVGSVAWRVAASCATPLLLVRAPA